MNYALAKARTALWRSSTQDSSKARTVPFLSVTQEPTKTRTAFFQNRMQHPKNQMQLMAMVCTEPWGDRICGGAGAFPKFATALKRRK